MDVKRKAWGWAALIAGFLILALTWMTVARAMLVG
jgi:hypothetical protein